MLKHARHQSLMNIQVPISMGIIAMFETPLLNHCISQTPMPSGFICGTAAIIIGSSVLLEHLRVSGTDVPFYPSPHPSLTWSEPPSLRELPNCLVSGRLL